MDVHNMKVCNQNGAENDQNLKRLLYDGELVRTDD